jgi:tRNA (adenine37-N6)-methyltransferase
LTAAGIKVEDGDVKREWEPIGVIRTPFANQAGMPIQPSRSGGGEGTVEMFEDYREGLTDLDGFSHVILLYVFDRSEGYELTVTPFRDTVPRGLFATRAPRRPNPIGLSVVRLLAVEGGTLHVADLDILDGTPLLDIKPFNPAIDHRDGCRIGWMEGRFGAGQDKPSDDRFASKSPEKP